MQFKKTVAALLALSVSALTLTGAAEAGRRHHHHHGGAAVAGLFGFAAGAILGSALSQPRYYYREPVYVGPPPVVYEPSPVYSAYAEPWTPEWYAYCDARYRTFDPQTGYFLGYDRHYHFCR